MNNMVDTVVKAPVQTIALRVLGRVVVVLFAALAVGTLLSRVSASLDRDDRPAGFTRGAIQGALMPMALPTLLIGRDVPIYSQRNTGVSYKLGYTVGVNICGAIFFGLFYWRVSRLRKWSAQKPSTAERS